MNCGFVVAFNASGGKSDRESVSESSLGLVSMSIWSPLSGLLVSLSLMSPFVRVVCVDK